MIVFSQSGTSDINAGVMINLKVLNLLTSQYIWSVKAALKTKQKVIKKSSTFVILTHLWLPLCAFLPSLPKHIIHTYDFNL